MSKVDELSRYFKEKEISFMAEFFEFLRFKSIGTDPEFRQDTLACADWVAFYLKNSGLNVEIWKTDTFPIIYAHDLSAGEDKPTVLIYNHYDVQPVDPLELWNTPPFEPNLHEDGTITARGAQDNKGQCFYVMAAVAYLVKKGNLNVNIKLVIEGEEEAGSTEIEKILKVKQKELQADHLLVVDAGFEKKDKPGVTLGVRGLTALEVKVSGSKSDLHSGVYGGIALNPNHALVRLLASLRDEKGKITVEGFYDDITPTSEDFRKNLSFDFDEKEFEKETGILPKGGEEDYSPLESNWLRPTLEVNGIRGGYGGEGFKTVIPKEAIAKISCRLVPGQDPKKIANLIKKHLEQRTPEGIKIDVKALHGGEAVRTNPLAKVVEATSRAYSEVFNKECRNILCGASIPIVSELAKTSNSEVVLLGYGLPEDLIHAPNENFSIDRLEKGFITIVRILEILGED